MTSIYDAAGQLTALVDQKANRTSFTYDLAGRRTQLIDPLNRRLTSTYDLAGRQTQRIDARGFRTTYGYDGLDRVTKRRYPNATRATFAYDAVGNRTQMRDSSGLYTFSYDSLNRVSETRNPLGKVLTYSYDQLSRRTRLRDHDGGRFTYAYDDNSRLTVVRNPQDQRSSFVYDAVDRRTVTRLGNGTRTSLAYDSASQTTQVFHRKSDGTSILQLDYRYDTAGNRTVQIEGGTTARTTWAYDAQNQLLGEHRTGTNAYRQTFAYDPAGNRTLKDADGVRTTFNYDAANQLTYSLAAAGRTTYGYDAAGNQRIEQPSAGARTTTTWDYENQPTQYRLPTGSPVTMTYNADNRRVQSQQSTTVTKFVWDMQTDAYLSELNSANATQAEYTNEPVLFGSVISQRRGNTTHWLHADALGSTRILTTSAGASSDTYLYDAWGNPINSSGSTVNSFRWVGRYGYYFDTVTGMFYVRARTYQPTVARWTSVDPLGFVFQINLYAYGDILSSVDPTGMWTTKEVAFEAPLSIDCRCGDTKEASLTFSVGIGFGGGGGAGGKFKVRNLPGRVRGLIGIDVGVSLTCTLQCALDGTGTGVLEKMCIFKVRWEEERTWVPPWIIHICLPSTVDTFCFEYVVREGHWNYDYRNARIVIDDKVVSDTTTCC